MKNYQIKKSCKKVIFFTNVDRFCRDVEYGIENAEILTSRGNILVFLGNNLIINTNDIENKTDRFRFLKNCIEIGENESKTKSKKMIDRNILKRKDPDSYELIKSMNNISVNNNPKRYKTSSSSLNSNSIRNVITEEKKECTLNKSDFDKHPYYANKDGNCGHCGVHVGGHPKKAEEAKNTGMFSSFTNIFKR